MKLPFRKRLQAANELLDSYSGDGYTRGRAEQVVGGLLIADGLFGIENPLDGVKTRGGLKSALTGLVVGGVFLVVGIAVVHLVSSNVPENATEGQGTVISVKSSTTTSTSSSSKSSSTTSTSCTITAGYSVKGVQYQTSGGNGSSDQCGKSAGQSVAVTYNALRPEIGIVTQTNGWIVFLFPIVGGLVLLGSMGSVIRCVTELVGGGLLLRHGGKLVKTNPAVPVDQMMADLTGRFSAILGKMGKGRFNRRTQTVNPMSLMNLGGSSLLGNLMGGQAPSTPQNAAPTQPSPPPPPAALPPPGWYAEAAGSDALQWWDGTQWTGHRQAGSQG